VEKMRKEKDIQRLKEITKLLIEVFMILGDIEDVEEIFNSDKAIEVIKKYPSINASLDDLIHDLVSYFNELRILHKKR
jgi:Mg2+ and Co2+ transporter CorA